MGICFSKKSSSSPPPPSSSAVVAAASPPPLPPPPPNPKSDTNKLSLSSPSLPTTAPEETVKKEIFIIKQRKSHERRPEDRPHFATTKVAAAVAPPQSPSPPSLVLEGNVGKATPVRTSSCTKEEVDAILIQCGRLSRSSSGTGKASNSCDGEGGSTRKYSGSKRSFDFDQDNKNNGLVEEEGHCSRTTHRRTPSREKDEECKRSGSRHRSSSASREEERKRISQNGGSTSRRLSRSPGRRSETTPSAGGVVDKSKGPGKMVSVPASTTGAIKRVSVKRSTASPRSQSPANARENAHQQHPPSLSRNSSRKAEHSPYRRNPLSEIDDNCLKTEQIPAKQQDHQTNKKSIGSNNKVQSTKEIDEAMAAKKPFQFQSNSQSQKPDERNSSVITDKSLGKNKKNINEQEEQHYEGNESRRIEISTQPPQTITRSRSSRRSRDLDFLNNASNPNDEDSLVNVPTSYASLLLEDIQNFHQKNPSNSAFTLPPCVTKACSILDAVADLNSSNTSHVSNTLTSEEVNGHSTNNKNKVSLGKKDCEVVTSSKDPFVETEVFVYDDLMEPSIHKYITVRRGKTEGGGEMEQQESSGSNSVVGQQWFSSSSWEPNSADSTDHWTSSSNTGDEVVVDKEEPSHQHKRKVYSEGARKLRSSGNCSTQLNSVTMSGKRREIDQLPQGGKVGASPVVAAASM